jgi:NAD+ synthase (glutamine-hydrolysing)
VCRRLDETKKSALAPKMAKPLSAVGEIYRALVLGTHDYVRKNGFQKVVIGLSGGIDSSLTAVIACDAVGKENVVGISMPSQFSSEGTRTDARKTAENLGIQFMEIPIQDIFESYLKTLEEEFSGQKKGITEENLQARIRGNILMAFSNKFGWLVLTTGNKSEIAVGYCTLYGDMAGGFSVIKDVPKMMIYKLAHFRNDSEGKLLIPESVFERAPTAELRENQKDEDSLPPYEVLDPILKNYVELDKSLSQLNQGVPHDLAVKVIEMVDKNEYKRRQAPPGVRITPKAFGKDRRLPITNKYLEY